MFQEYLSYFFQMINNSDDSYMPDLDNLSSGLNIDQSNITGEIFVLLYCL